MVCLVNGTEQSWIDCSGEVKADMQAAVWLYVDTIVTFTERSGTIIDAVVTKHKLLPPGHKIPTELMWTIDVPIIDPITLYSKFKV